jgi:ABC-type glycerol-3-phosphate transport system substrate-binding protein
MRRAALLIVVAVMLVGLAALLGSRVPPAGAARPYEGQTIRAVVNAEYVKYSLTLVEKDLYDKLGVKIETEVIPADAFVSKTLLEFNSGSSPWDLVMFGPSTRGSRS